jgi:hypothetical protein
MPVINGPKTISENSKKQLWTNIEQGIHNIQKRLMFNIACVFFRTIKMFNVCIEIFNSVVKWTIYILHVTLQPFIMLNYPERFKITRRQ